MWCPGNQLTEHFKEGEVINCSNAVNGSSKMRPEIGHWIKQERRSVLTLKSSLGI